MWGIPFPGWTEVQSMFCVAKHINKITVFTTLIWRTSLKGVSMFMFLYITKMSDRDEGRSNEIVIEIEELLSAMIEYVSILYIKQSWSASTMITIHHHYPPSAATTVHHHDLWSTISIPSTIMTLNVTIEILQFTNWTDLKYEKITQLNLNIVMH